MAPVLFKAFATPSLRKIKLKSRFEMFLFGVIRNLDIKPSDKSIGKGSFKKAIYWLCISLFLIEILISRAVEATSLSLNVFCTLGFGNLPERVLPRYLCIAEGFLGWFLLSIFSVALISQVIQ